MTGEAQENGIKIIEINTGDYRSVQLPDLGDFTYEQMDSLRNKRQLVLRGYGIIPASQDKVELFRQKYLVNYLQESCSIINADYTSRQNKRIIVFMDRKYGSGWRGYLPATPFVLRKQ